MVRYADPKYVSCPGDPIKILYSPHVLPNGDIELIENGKENFQEYIQSFVQTTDIHEVLTRYKNGDTSVLMQRQPIYGDFTKQPKTLAEFMQLEINCRTMFENLPAGIRQQFDNDVNKFLASAGSEDWFGKVEPALSNEMREQLAAARMNNNIDAGQSVETKPVADGSQSVE